MEIFGYTLVKTSELLRNEIEVESKTSEIKKLEAKIVDTEGKYQSVCEENNLIKTKIKKLEAEIAAKESKYQSVCKENRHLEATIKRTKEHKL